MAAATASGDDGGVTAAETAPSTAAGGAGGQVGTTTHDSSGGDADERPFGELSLALHLAVWDDNIDEVRRLVELHSGPLRDADGGGGDGGGAAASSGAAEGAGGKSQAGGGGSSPGGHNKACTCLEVRDPRGRTPLQLAYSLNRDVAAKWLVLGGADARARMLGGWESYQAAALTANPSMLRTANVGQLAAADAAFEARLPALMDRLEAMPDFEMTIEWSTSTWLPLLGRHCPGDTLRIWKRGSSIRMDSTLLGHSGLPFGKWIRGHLTFILMGRRSQHPGLLVVLDRELKTATDLRRPFREPFDKHIQGWVEGLLTKPLKRADVDSRGSTMERAQTRGWLGGLTPATATVGRFEDCSVFKMSGVVRTEYEHPAVLKRVPEGWWKPSMSVRTGEPSVPDEVDIALQKQLSDALRDMQARRDKRARSSSTGSIGDVDVAVDDHDDDWVESTEVLRPEGKGVKHGEDYIRVGLGEEREEMGVGALTRKVTFDEYFNTPTTDAERALRRPWHGRYVEIPFERVDPSKHTAHPEAEIAHFFDEKVKQKVHKFDSVEVCFSKEFPLSVRNMMDVAAVMSRTQGHFDNFRRFYENKMPEGEGTPVRFSSYLFLSFTATFELQECELTTPSSSLFVVPDGFRMGAYEDRTVTAQL